MREVKFGSLTVLLKNKLGFSQTSYKLDYILSPTSTCRNADVGSVPRKDTIFSLVSRTLNSDLEHGQTRTIPSPFLLSAHCLGRFANIVSCGKEYAVRAPFQIIVTQRTVLSDGPQTDRYTTAALRCSDGTNCCYLTQYTPVL